MTKPAIGGLFHWLEARVRTDEPSRFVRCGRGTAAADAKRS
jgi:hypothetical protein